MQKQLKSCIPGSSVASGLGRHHWINGRGNQNPAFRGLQVPLVLGGFIESMAEATNILLAGIFSCLWSRAASLDQWQRQPKSRFLRSSVAFGLGRLHRINGRGNQNPAYHSLQLPLVLGGFIESMAEATKILLTRVFSCLWSWVASSDQWQRQLKSYLPGSPIAFGLGQFHRINGRGNQNPAYRGL